MTGKQILLSALQGQVTPRPAWLPLVGVHGGHLVGVTACAYCQSTDLIVAGLTRAIERYQPDGLPVLFDLQMEAEVLGCELGWAGQAPPCAATHPLGGCLDPSVLLAFDPSTGRYPIVLRALDRVRAQFGDAVAFYGLIAGPLTLASQLRGPALLLDLFDDPRGVQELVGYCATVARAAADAYLAHGADVIGVADPAATQISPAHFAEFVAPHARGIFEHIRARGALSSLLVWGDASRNLPAMGELPCDNLAVDEHVCLQTLRDLAHTHGKSFSGNLRSTSVLLTGSADDARLDAIRCLDVGKHQGFVLAPGSDLPYAVPPQNVQAVRDMVLDEYQRQCARTAITARSAVAHDTVELPDYGDPTMVYVDVVTIDSASCTPCQQMITAARRAADLAATRTVVREHRSTSRHGLAVMIRLAVADVPAVCIDGQVMFHGVIPDPTELCQAIDAFAAHKRPGP